MSRGKCIILNYFVWYNADMTKNHNHVIYDSDCDVCAKGYFEARRIAEGQVWTSEYPKEPGYYWVRNYKVTEWDEFTPGPRIVEIWLSESTGELLYYFTGSGDFFGSFGMICGEWFGPIQPPDDKASSLTELFHRSLTSRGKQVLASQAIDDLGSLPLEGSGK